MKKFLLFCIILSQGFVWAAEQKTEKTVIKLPERMVNLVILNDTSEQYYEQRQEAFPFPVDDKTSLNGRHWGAMINSLLYALLDEQLVLCTKELWHTLQSLAQVWKKYTVLDPNVKTLEYQTNRYRRAISKFHAQIEPFMTTTLEDVELIGFEQDEIDCLQEENVQQLFGLYCEYEQIIRYGYACKEVDENYILFIPQSLQSLPKDFVINPSQVTRQSNISELDLWLGLKVSTLIDYPYNRPDLGIPIGQIAYQKLGKALLSALASLVVDQQKLVKSVADYATILLPTFNIFLLGHGQYQGPMAAIQLADVSYFLAFLNNNIQTKSLTILSCYSGGEKVERLFKPQELIDNPLLSSIRYPIMFIGSFAAKVHMPKWFQEHIFQTEDFFSFFDRKLQRKLVVQNMGHFDKFFGFFYRQPVDYLAAARDFILSSGYMNHYVTIKYPGTSWFEPDSQGSNVVKITKTIAVGHNDALFINKKVDKVLLTTSVVDRELVIARDLKKEKRLPMILPLNYGKPYYWISSIKIKDPSTLQLAVADSFVDSKYLHLLVIRVLSQLFLNSFAGQIKEKIIMHVDSLSIGSAISLEKVDVNISARSAYFAVKGDGQFYHMYQENNMWTIDIITSPELVVAIQERVARHVHQELNAVPDQNLFSEKLRQVLQSVPPLAFKSQKLQQSWSPDKQRKELYDTRKVDPKEPNPYAKPFVPKSVQPKIQSVVKSENKYVKHVAPDGKVSWSLKPTV